MENVTNLAEVASQRSSAAAPLPDALAFGRGGFVFRNAWFAVVHTANVTGRPVQRMIDRTPIAVWRDGTGRVHAFEDRCCHRRAPLSEGRVVDGVLQCGYHGWRYDGSGRCVSIPSLAPGKPVPEAFCVRTFPATERYGYVWVWWGEPEMADEDLLPDVPFLRREGERGAVRSRIVFRTAQELAMENLLDMTHTDFLHGGMFGDPTAGEEDVSVESTDEVVTMTRVAKARKAPAAIRPFFGFPKTVSYYETIRIYIRSGVAYGVGWVDPPGWGMGILLTNLPAAPDQTRQDGTLVMLRRPRREGGKGGRVRWAEILVGSWAPRILTRQDRRMLGGQYPAFQRDDPRPDRSVPSDVAGLRFRKLREQLIRRQMAGDLSYPSGWKGNDAADVNRCDRVG